MKSRIKQIRKDYKLTQVEFGERIGVKGNTVTGYETGLRNPTDAIIISICREFNVNEHWLRTGEGIKYNPKEDETASLVSELLEENNSLYDLIKDIIKIYIKLDPKSQEVINKFSEELLNSRNIKKED
ncbi:MAG: helix-turn-helix domain-containing protein [Lachnospiraceae bacterium]|nr:helix-turn-helix domain-containing protein [Lachnospiraceae bacterium]